MASKFASKSKKLDDPRLHMLCPQLNIHAELH